MKIKSVEIFPIKIPKAPIYLGTSSGLRDDQDYYLRPEYRAVYSKKLETLLIKITTECGLSGWGEALAPVVPEVPGEIVRRLFTPLLIGEDPRNYEVIWSRLYDSMRDRGYFTGFMVDTISAVDIALWDLLAKSVNLPVHQLLGGAYRKELPAYVSGLPKQTTNEKIALALEWKEKGFQAIKLHLGLGVEEDADIVRQIRTALGEHTCVMVDAHWAYTVPQSIRLGRMLEQWNVDFLEAPIQPEDVDGTAELTQALGMPVAVGEAIRTKYQYRTWLEKRAMDIIQPDIARIGITEMRKIAFLAESYHTPVAPHLSIGLGISIAATLQLSAAIPNFYMLEYQPTVFPTANSILKQPLVCENGRYLLPEGPGLGIEIDEDKVKAFTVS